MRSNYQPWQLNINDFHKQSTDFEKLKFLLNFAVLAPSSHNSQPWRFEVHKNLIRVFLERSRCLFSGDENNRQSYISLGCSITNIMIAADYYGFDCNLVYYPDINNEKELLVSDIKIINKSNPTSLLENHLIFSIPRRITNRNQYEKKFPLDTFLDNIKKYSNDDLEIHIIKDKEKKDKLADIAVAASVAAMENKDFRRELSQYVKPNITSSPIGMPCFGMGIPTPVSFIVPIMIKYLNMNKLSYKKDRILLKSHTPIFVIIATRNDDKLNWLKTGELYERIALIATREGLSTAMWAAPIQIGEYYRDFKEILETNFRPQAFFRLGYAVKTPSHSPRLSSRMVSVNET